MIYVTKPNYIVVLINAKRFLGGFNILYSKLKLGQSTNDQVANTMHHYYSINEILSTEQLISI